MYVVNNKRLLKLAFTHHLDEKRLGTTRRARLSNIQIFQVVQQAIRDVQIEDSFVITFPRQGSGLYYTGILIKRHGDVLVVASIYEETRGRKRRTIFIRERHRINTSLVVAPEIDDLLLILKEAQIIKMKSTLKFYWCQLKNIYSASCLALATVIRRGLRRI